MEKFNPNILVEPDGNFTPSVREWSLEKYRLVGSYCDIFTSGMKSRWNQLVYLDLFAGAGYATIQETGKTYFSSALIAMSIPTPFTKYILCESDPDRFKALEKRVKTNFSHLDVTLFYGDSNIMIEQVFKAIPPYKKGNTMLPFCFVDPYSLNLNFRTIETLGGKILMDFLILQALHMDGNRNLLKYLKDENEKIALYLGDENWREDFNHGNKEYSVNLVKFLADKYVMRMKSLGYIPEKNMHQIRSSDKNLPLYYLAFYSKHPRGIDFYKRIEKYSNQQFKLDI
ncbi:MAG: three-Cys-motif partner protein TcmP [Bacteroidetes bacterium]|nr:three-Cys-motif partner protein TcmP [Bacteroidota bacterium]